MTSILRGRPAILGLASAQAVWQKISRPVPWLLALTFLHGMLYAAVVAPWQAPDETVHYEYLRALSQAHEVFPHALERSQVVYQQVSESARLFRYWEFLRQPTPAETPPSPGPVFAVRGFWSLYYRLSLPVYWAVSSWPIESQLYVLRLFSVALQCVTVWFTYQLARLIFPVQANPALALIPLAAAFVVAVFPQYTFISASYNDDNLVPPLVAGTLYSLVRGLHQNGAGRWLALASLTTALAILTKRTAISLVLLWGLCILAYAVTWLRSTPMFHRAVGGLVLFAAAGGSLAAIYLLIRPPVLPAALANRLFIEPDAWAALAAYLREPARLASVDWLSALLFLSISFWGWFGWLKVPLGTHLMEILRRVTVLLIAGCTIESVRAGLAVRAARPLHFSLRGLMLLGLGMVISLSVLVAQFLIGPPIYALVGRYLFPFISAFGILAAWGWQAWWPARWKTRGLLIGLVLLAAVDFAALALTIVPYFYT